MSLSASDSVLLAQLSATSWVQIFGTVFLGLAALLLLKLGPKQFLFYLSRPYDTFVLVKYVAFARAKVPKDISSDMKCRSFAAVIIELHPELKDAICLFYLVLRGLDTVEDDMEIDPKVKSAELRTFYRHLDDPGWNSRIGWGKADKHEEQLLNEFQRVTLEIQKLKPAYQETIKDICKKMGEGMAEFIDRNFVDSIKDYELYCHYVAGLVGEVLPPYLQGLSALFHNSGLEGSRFANVEALSNSMGLFLQKTNITRDYLEDISENPPRIFYPKEIWGHYGKDIRDFKEPENREKALHLLNHMITNAVEHVPDVVAYMELVTEPSVFRFCAIPQIMAIATLSECYNNPEVFQKTVKITKLDAVKLITTSSTHAELWTNFLAYLEILDAKIPSGDPTGPKLKKLITANRKIVSAALAKHK